MSDSPENADDQRAAGIDWMQRGIEREKKDHEAMLQNWMHQRIADKKSKQWQFPPRPKLAPVPPSSEADTDEATAAAGANFRQVLTALHELSQRLEEVRTRAIAASHSLTGLDGPIHTDLPSHPLPGTLPQFRPGLPVFDALGMQILTLARQVQEITAQLDRALAALDA
jgi:hypothetical protein